MAWAKVCPGAAKLSCVARWFGIIFLIEQEELANERCGSTDDNAR